MEPYCRAFPFFRPHISLVELGHGLFVLCVGLVVSEPLLYPGYGQDLLLQSLDVRLACAFSEPFEQLIYFFVIVLIGSVP